MIRDNDSNEEGNDQSDSEGEEASKMTQYFKDLQKIKERSKQEK